MIHFERVGAGAPMLIVHGGPGMHHSLYHTLDDLGALRELIYFDHRGHGRSGPLPDGPIDMKLFADDAVALADRLGFGRFDVFGHSFGGWVAQQIAVDHPERVSALIVAGTTPGQLGHTESPDDDQGPPMPDEIAELMSRRPASDAELIEIYGALGPYLVRMGDPAVFVQALDEKLVSADSMVRVFDALGRWSVVDRLASVSCPTLAIAGRRDDFCSVQQLERIVRRVPGAELVVFEQSGHFMWLEERDRFFDVVGAWLRAH